ncbi:hypothetical protein EVA_13113 [gut metagenome]|uniref:Uncharacterized protein n=1 Tax=gut metagenome TaxID=749906 RepID=J9GH87_9ZZZZ
MKRQLKNTLISTPSPKATKRLIKRIRRPFQTAACKPSTGEWSSSTAFTWPFLSLTGSPTVSITPSSISLYSSKTKPSPPKHFSTLSLICFGSWLYAS